jgi:hypothetical protein
MSQTIITNSLTQLKMNIRAFLCRRTSPTAKPYYSMVDICDVTKRDMFTDGVQAYTREVGLVIGIFKVLKYVWQFTAAVKIFTHNLLAMVFIQEGDLSAADRNETNILDDGIHYLDDACNACLY